MDPVAVTPALAEAVESHMRRVARRDRVPGIAYGIVSGGELIHAGGVGRLGVNAGEPDEHSLFRIASMTKSFTASAVIHLRDAGRLALDDPIAAHVPEVAGWRGPTADSPPITVRHLLTMASGLATDDPWADRHVDVDRRTMDGWLRGGAAFAGAPGEAFEYSNLGYGILGRAVENVSGRKLQAYITDEFLTPLGMTSTVWALAAVPGGVRVADGFQQIDGDPMPVGPPLGDGDLAGLGGLWSTVRDLTRWVAFFMDAFPPRDDPDTLPLSRASRREMQEVSTSCPLSLVSSRELAPVRASLAGYGMGLGVRDDLSLGRIVEHTGGFPGFGSHMAWLPGRGLGVIALGNTTYALMRTAVADTLDILREHDALPPFPVRGSPELTRAAVDLGLLVSEWDGAVAEALFSDNVFLDRDEAARVAEMEQLRARHGRLQPATVTATSAARGTVRWQADEGELRATLTLTPQVPPRVQWYQFTSVLPLTTAHHAANEQLLELLRDPDPDPERVRARFTDDADITDVRDRLEAVSAMFGSCAQAETVAGDGGPTAIVHWCGERGDLDVTITLAGDRIAAVVFQQRPIEPGSAG